MPYGQFGKSSAGWRGLSLRSRARPAAKSPRWLLGRVIGAWVGPYKVRRRVLDDADRLLHRQRLCGLGHERRGEWVRADSGVSNLPRQDYGRTRRGLLPPLRSVVRRGERSPRDTRQAPTRDRDGRVGWVQRRARAPVGEGVPPHARERGRLLDGEPALWHGGGVPGGEVAPVPRVEDAHR